MTNNQKVVVLFHQAKPILDEIRTLLKDQESSSVGGEWMCSAYTYLNTGFNLWFAQIAKEKETDV